MNSLKDSFRRYFFRPLVLLAIILTNCHQLRAADSTQVARAHSLVEGFSANYEAFQFYSMDLKIQQGTAISEEQAIRLGPTKDITTAITRHVFDSGNQWRSWTRESNASLIPAPGEDGFYATLPPQLLLKGDEHSLFGAAFVEAARIGPGFHEDAAPDTPWNLGGAIADGEAGTFSAALGEILQLRAFESLEVKNTQVDNQPVVLVDVDWMSPDGSGPHRYVFVVDELRGCIPVRQETYFSGQLFSVSVVTKIRECTSERWFPEHCIRINGFGAPDSLLSVRELVVSKLDVDRRPSKEEFQVTVPAGYQIHDGINPDANFRLQEAEVVGIDDLDDLYSRTQAAAGRRRGDPDWRSNSSIGLFFVVIGCAVFIGILVFILYRKASAIRQ